MEAKEFLLQIQKLDKLIENKLVEVQQLKNFVDNISPSYSSMDRVQSTHNPHRTSDAICKYIDLDKEINQCIDKLIKVKKDVIGVIEQLDRDEYDVLHKVYVQYLSLKEVAYSCDKSPSWVKGVHKKAVEHVQNILDG